MAIEDAGGRAGRLPVEVVFADHQNKPDVGMATARRWMDQDGVDAVLDVPNSAIALGVAELVRERNRVFIASGGGMGGGPGGDTSNEIATWVAATFTAQTVDGVTVYDLSAGVQ